MQTRYLFQQMQHNEDCCTGGDGIYYVRGTFVQMQEQTIVLSDTDNRASARIGLE